MHNEGEVSNLSLQMRDKEGIKVPYPDLVALFELAERNGLSEQNPDNYYSNYENTSAILLPKEMQKLTLGDPGQYYLVFYEDRRDDSYYKESMGRFALISARKNRPQSNDPFRELWYSQETNKNGYDEAFVAVAERVNEKSAQNINSADDTTTEEPYGSRKIKYKINPEDGSRIPIDLSISRLDEILLPLDEKRFVTRWVRNLNISKDENQEPDAIYSDHYIIGRSQEILKERRADISIRVRGNIDNPRMIKVEIGSGPEQSARILLEDLEKNIKIIIHSGAEEGFDLLRQDPQYGFLSKSNDQISTDDILSLFEFRADLLREHWNQSQSVFESSGLESNGRQSLPE